MPATALLRWVPSPKASAAGESFAKALHKGQKLTIIDFNKRVYAEGKEFAWLILQVPWNFHIDFQINKTIEYNLL